MEILNIPLTARTSLSSLRLINPVFGAAAGNSGTVTLYKKGTSAIFLELTKGTRIQIMGTMDLASFDAYGTGNDVLIVAGID